MSENGAYVKELEPIIRKFIRLRSYIDSEKEKLKAAMAEYEKHKTFLGNYLASTLVQSKLDSVAAPSGTVFTTSKVEYRVVDKTTFLRWLLTQNAFDIWELVELKPDAKEVDAWASRRFEDYCESVKQQPNQPPPQFTDFIPPGLNRSATVFAKVRKRGEVTDE
jgi:hypothetical protein